jgi:hypothetical protein
MAIEARFTYTLATISWDCFSIKLFNFAFCYIKLNSISADNSKYYTVFMCHIK